MPSSRKTRFSTMDDYRINPTQLPFAVPPFSYEYIAARANGKWRIKDAKDNAMGSAENEEAAIFICNHLNSANQ